MWDIDQEGTVVNIFFSDGDKKISVMELDIYYELHGIRDGFYFIRQHLISSDLAYRYTDYLIPASMAYLERAGTITEFEKKNIDFYYADADTKDGLIMNMIKAKVLRDYIYTVTGEFVLTEKQDMDNLVGDTGRKVSSFLSAVHEGHCTVGVLKTIEDIGGESIETLGKRGMIK